MACDCSSSFSRSGSACFLIASPFFWSGFVLIGDSGEKDPEIYAATVRDHPGRIIAVAIREVRLDPGDGRVEAVTDGWEHDVPFVLAADTDAIRHHLVAQGLL